MAGHVSESYTERFHLRQLDNRDVADLYSFKGHPAVYKYIAKEPLTSIKSAEDFLDFINGGMREKKWVYWGICDEDSVLGTISLWNFNEDRSKADIGYELHPDRWGEGILSECLPHVLSYGFETLKLTTIEAYTHSKNIASRKLLERYHFGLTTKTDGDNVIYKLCKREFSKNVG